MIKKTNLKQHFNQWPTSIIN